MCLIIDQLALRGSQDERGHALHLGRQNILDMKQPFPYFERSISDIAKVMAKNMSSACTGAVQMEDEKEADQKAQELLRATFAAQRLSSPPPLRRN